MLANYARQPHGPLNTQVIAVDEHQLVRSASSPFGDPPLDEIPGLCPCLVIAQRDRCLVAVPKIIRDVAHDNLPLLPCDGVFGRRKSVFCPLARTATSSR
jgi:hypothetical protein